MMSPGNGYDPVRSAFSVQRAAEWVHLLAAEPGLLDAGLCDVVGAAVRGQLYDVAVEDDEIRRLADVQRARVLVDAEHARAVDGVGVDGFVDRQVLCGVQRLAAGIAPSDGMRQVDEGPRVACLHRGVGSRGGNTPGVLDRSGCVAAGDGVVAGVCVAAGFCAPAAGACSRQHRAPKTGRVVNADTSIDRRIQCLWCTGALDYGVVLGCCTGARLRESRP